MLFFRSRFLASLFFGLKSSFARLNILFYQYSNLTPSKLTHQPEIRAFISSFSKPYKYQFTKGFSWPSSCPGRRKRRGGGGTALQNLRRSERNFGDWMGVVFAQIHWQRDFFSNRPSRETLKETCRVRGCSWQPSQEFLFSLVENPEIFSLPAVLGGPISKKQTSEIRWSWSPGKYECEITSVAIWVVVSDIFYFNPTWGNDPIWLIFFNWVETTN